MRWSTVLSLSSPLVSVPWLVFYGNCQSLPRVSTNALAYYGIRNIFRFNNMYRFRGKPVRSSIKFFRKFFLRKICLYISLSLPLLPQWLFLDKMCKNQKKICLFFQYLNGSLKCRKRVGLELFLIKVVIFSLETFSILGKASYLIKLRKNLNQSWRIKYL